MELLDDDGYPAEEFLEFLRNWTYESPELIEEVLDMIEEAWCYNKLAFKRRQPRKGVQTIEMHTVGWSGNESIIDAILSNLCLTHFRLQYHMWITGGHHYFKFKIK